MGPLERLNNIAIIFAGGVGTRMGNPELPKQLMEVAGKPIFVYTLERFEKNPRIDAIYLVVALERIGEVRAVLENAGISKVRRIVVGGASAHASTFNGLLAAEDDGVPEEAVVIIHDGVRPIISNSLITQSVAQVLEKGSAITSIPAYETVGISRDANQIEAIPERSEMFALQGPQSFRLGKALKYNRIAEAEGRIGSFVDQAHLMNHYGEIVHLLPGIRSNIKITVPEDLDYFNFLVAVGRYEEIISA